VADGPNRSLLVEQLLQRDSVGACMLPCGDVVCVAYVYRRTRAVCAGIITPEFPLLTDSVHRIHPTGSGMNVFVLVLVLVDVGRGVQCELLLPHSRSRRFFDVLTILALTTLTGSSFQ